jgi:hypothetical protein
MRSRVEDTQAEIAAQESNLAGLRSRLVTEAGDDYMYAILKEEIKRVGDTLDQLRKRETRVSWQASLVDQFVNNLESALRQYLQQWDGPKTAGVADNGNLVYRFGDPDHDDRYLEVEVSDQDRELSWQEKRHLMGLLGVKVKLYATNSDYYRENGKQWEFTFAENGPVENTAW